MPTHALRPALSGRTTPPQSEDKATWAAFLFFMILVGVAVVGGLVSIAFV